MTAILRLHRYVTACCLLQVFKCTRCRAHHRHCGVRCAQNSLFYAKLSVEINVTLFSVASLGAWRPRPGQHNHWRLTTSCMAPNMPSTGRPACGLTLCVHKRRCKIRFQVRIMCLDGSHRIHKHVASPASSLVASRSRHCLKGRLHE